MKIISVPKGDFEKLKQLQIERGWKRLAFSTNYKEQIWPATRLGLVPEDEREHMAGVIALLDEIVCEYLKHSETGGRFFIEERGVFYRREAYDSIQFITFQFV